MAFGVCWMKSCLPKRPAALAPEVSGFVDATVMLPPHRHDCKLPTQAASGRARCFCGAEIGITDMDAHIYAAHRLS
jgi:hypothetical protein